MREIDAIWKDEHKRISEAEMRYLEAAPEEKPLPSGQRGSKHAAARAQRGIAKAKKNRRKRK